MNPDAILSGVMIEISISVIPILFLLTEEIMVAQVIKKKKKPRDFVVSVQN